MDDFIISRALHVLSIVGWIGGVTFVTTVVMPSIRHHHPPEERLEELHRIESRFVWQARFWVLLAGATGFWMVYRTQMWDRFTDPHFWWMHAMVGLWAIFMMMLFVIEPLVIHKRLTAPSAEPARVYARIERMHRVLLGLAVLTVLAAVAGAHGLFY